MPRPNLIAEFKICVFRIVYRQNSFRTTLVSIGGEKGSTISAEAEPRLPVPGPRTSLTYTLHADNTCHASQITIHVPKLELASAESADTHRTQTRPDSVESPVSAARMQCHGHVRHIFENGPCYRNGTILPGPVMAIKRTELEDFVWRGAVLERVFWTSVLVPVVCT